MTVQEDTKRHPWNLREQDTPTSVRAFDMAAIPADLVRYGLPDFVLDFYFHGKDGRRSAFMYGTQEDGYELWRVLVVDHASRRWLRDSRSRLFFHESVHDQMSATRTACICAMLRETGFDVAHARWFSEPSFELRQKMTAVDEAGGSSTCIEKRR